MMDIAAEKISLRRQALARRAACDPALGAELATHIMRQCRPPPGAKIAAFISLPGEMSTAPIISALADENFTLCLPFTPPRGEALEFRAWRPGDILHPGRFGTVHPEGPVMVPDFILVPLLAFDAQGNRLGYGGGYYDRTLAARPKAYRLGLAFAAQEFSSLPTGPEDVSLHAIATEHGVVKIDHP
jgi:5-formyltetrahydrofolate cyclo-ligase